MGSVSKDQKELSKSLKETLSSTELGKIGEDITELALDSILKEGVLKDFPIIGALVGIWKSGIAVSDYLFLRKLLAFLNESSKLSTKKRIKLIEKLEQEEFQQEAGEKLLSTIDKLETTSKAKMLGEAIYLFGDEVITKEEFWRVTFVISKLPLADILALKNWEKTELNNVDKIRIQLYLSVGIGWFVMNVSSTGFCWQENLCRIFADKLLNKSFKK